MEGWKAGRPGSVDHETKLEQGACSVSVGEAVLISFKGRRPQGPGMSQDALRSRCSKVSYKAVPG